MENSYLDQISNLFNITYPEANTFEEYLDIILPAVKGNSEDLREHNFYVNKPWVEVSEDESKHELIFHFFSLAPKDIEEGIAESEHLKTVDGKVTQGKWRYVGNKIFIGDADYENTYIYELAFLDNEFFILKLLANPKKIKEDKTEKYFVLTSEKLGRKLEWLELARHLYAKYHPNNLIYYFIGGFIVLIIVLLLTR